MACSRCNCKQFARTQLLGSISHRIWLAQLILVFFSLVLTGKVFAFQSGEAYVANPEATARIQATIEFLASDKLAGRGVGTEGISEAADYIKHEFKQAGLQIDAVQGDAYQEFDIPWKTEIGPPEKNRLALIPPAVEGAAPKVTELVLDRDFTPMGESGSASVKADVVFAGYGITAKDEGYDDYADLDVEGKVVVILRREPQQDNPHSVFNGTENSTHAMFRIKVSNAYEHGAAALVIVNDAYSLRESSAADRKRISETLEQIAKEKQAFADLTSPSLEQIRIYAAKLQKLAVDLEKQSQQMSQSADLLVEFREASGNSNRKMPVLFAKREVVAQAIQETFGTKEQPMNLEQIEQEIDRNLKPQSRALTGWQMDLQTDIIRQRTNVKNVIGVIPGKGSLKDEYVIVGAHYDHVGMGGAGSGSLAPWTNEIHNGADDNASGTAGLLELARLAAKFDAVDQRTLVFIAFTGEERGLLGSSYYVHRPLFPLEKTVAMINLDMIGRLKENKLIVYGTGTADTFDTLVDVTNKEFDFQIVKKPTGYGPSDHESFYSAKIPVFHMFTGLHQDYHRPSDDTDKIDFAGTARVVGFVDQILKQLAIVPQRPKYIEIGRERMANADQSGERPYFGSQPDFGSEIEGYAISGASKDSPAEKAGLKGGDVIIKLGESRIGGLEDFDSALRKYKAGDSVKVIVIRDGKEVEFDVILESR
jgi:hypothetical protein